MNNFTEQVLIVLTTRIAITIAKDFWIFLKTKFRKPNQVYQINAA
jgi:DNA/RNA endonuclease YhcR with UshA esterase domain